MPIEFLTGLVIGLLFGAAIAWAIVVSNERASHSNALAVEGMKTATAEALVTETRDQVRAWKQETIALREKVQKYTNAYYAADTRFKEGEKNIQQQRVLLDQAQAKLSESFKALAAQALASNNRGFLILAEENFKAIKKEATVELDARKEAIEALVRPVSETLASYQKETKDLEERRLKEIGAVGEQLRSVAVSQNQLQQETSKLVNALKSPHVRGRWGEIALKRTAELAGMTAHCDFREQTSVTSEDGRLRPDMLIKLPAGRDLVVDSKVPLAAFLDALEANTDKDRESALDRHAKQVSDHVVKLSNKEYWAQFPSAPEFVILFIPNDSFLAAAAERDPNLIESALSKGVVIATPATFIALLRTIEFGWRQQTAVKNAKEISKLGQELSDRFAVFVDHMRKVGVAVGKAVESYNAAVGSFDNRIRPQTNKFKELGAGGKREIEELPLIDMPLRVMTNSDNKEDE